MTWPLPDPRLERDLEYPSDPDLTERELLHDAAMEDGDLAYRHAPLAYVEAPSDRERQQHRQEREARNTLRPRTGQVTVQPRTVPCTCGAATRGLRHAGPAHKHSCALYSPRVDHETEAA